MYLTTIVKLGSDSVVVWDVDWTRQVQIRPQRRAPCVHAREPSRSIKGKRISRQADAPQGLSFVVGIIAV
jgi:hypothetical protein